MGKKTMVWFVLSLVMTMLSMLANSSPPPSPSSAQGISCRSAVTQMLPCSSVLTGSSSAPPTPECCLAAQKLYREANTTEIRRDLCKCFKKVASLYHIDPARARQLAQLCGLNYSIPIEPNVDCSKIPI